VKHHTENPVEVYNFEVADWHTYFVGYWMWLVHNTKVCIHSILKVIYGSTDLGKVAQKFRKANKIKGGRNIAVEVQGCYIIFGKKGQK
jgi:hypothetical protein